jgi:hypothetical protein
MTLFGKRPQTLCEVVSRVRRGEQTFDAAILEFLDTFHAYPELRPAAVGDRPEPIDALHDAYVSAVAEHLCRLYALPVPEWTESHGNGLSEPFFAGGLESLKGVLLAESPTAFRRRLLFVSENALSRPRMVQARADPDPGSAAAPQL